MDRVRALHADDLELIPGTSSDGPSASRSDLSAQSKQQALISLDMVPKKRKMKCLELFLK